MSVMPTIGPPARSWRRWPRRGRSCLSRHCGNAASTTTIASSTTIPMARTIANSVEKFTPKPSAHIAANAPTMVTGTVGRGHQHGAPVLEEDQDHDEYQRRRGEQRFVDLEDRSVDEDRRVERRRVDEPLREDGATARPSSPAPRARQSARSRRASGRSPCRLPGAVEGEHLAVGLRHPFDPADVAYARHLAGIAGLDDHALELFGVSTAGRGAPSSAGSSRRRRRRHSDLPAVTAGFAVPATFTTSEALRPRAFNFSAIEPDPHRILAGAEQLDLGRRPETATIRRSDWMVA